MIRGNSIIQHAHNGLNTQNAPNISKLKNDYQVYMMQLSQTVSSDTFSTPLKHENNISLKDEIIMNAMNVDLQIKDINKIIKSLQRLNLIKKPTSDGV